MKMKTRDATELRGLRITNVEVATVATIDGEVVPTVALVLEDGTVVSADVLVGDDPVPILIDDRVEPEDMTPVRLTLEPPRPL